MIRNQTTSVGDSIASSLRGFGPIGIVAFLIILFVGPAWFRAILVLIWARWSGTPYSEIGYVRPKSWLVTFVLGIAFGVGLKFIMKAVIMPLLGAPALNQSYHFLVGNKAALPGMLFTLIAGAGFGEETVFRGYLFERLKKILGRGRNMKMAILLITSAIFGLAHFVDQGVPGVEQALFTGMFFGTMFVVTGQIWLPMVAHAAFDLAALDMIYWGCESQIAHLFFK